MVTKRSDLRNNLTDLKVRTSSHLPDNPSANSLPLLPQEDKPVSVGQLLTEDRLPMVDLLPTVANRHHTVHLLPPMEPKLLTEHQLLNTEAHPSTAARLPTVARHPTAALKFHMVDQFHTRANLLTPASLHTQDLTVADGELTKCEFSEGKPFVHYLRVYPKNHSFNLH